MDKDKPSVTLKSRAIAGGKWTAASAVVGIIIQLIQLSLLGRLLGPGEFGLMAIMMVVIGLANAVADFGVSNYLVQADSVSRALVRRLVGMGLSLSIVLSGSIAIIAPALASYYEMPQLADTLPWFGLVVIYNTLAQIYTAVLQRAFEFPRIAIIDIISATAGLLVSVLLAFYGWGLWALVFGQLSTGLVKAMASWVGVQSSIKQLPAESLHQTGHAMRFGAFQVGERVLNFVSANFDKLIIGKLLGEQALGIYSVAFQLILRPVLVINPIFNRVAMPMFANVKNDNPRLTRGYLEMLRTICFVTFPIYLILCISAPTIISLLLGSKWGNAETLTSILALLGFLFAAGNPIGVLVIAKGRVDLALYFNSVVVVVNLIAVYLGSLLGIYWVAFFFVATSWLILFPLEFYLRYKLIGMGISDYLCALKPHFIAAGVPLAVFAFANGFGIEPVGQIETFLAGLLAVSAYLGYFYLFDRQIITNTLALIFSRRLHN